MAIVWQKLEELAWPTSWAEAEAFTRRLVDRVGRPIDEGILEAVVVFNLLNAGVGEGGSANSGKIYMQNDGYNDFTREILRRICYELVPLWRSSNLLHGRVKIGGMHF